MNEWMNTTANECNNNWMQQPTKATTNECNNEWTQQRMIVTMNEHNNERMQLRTNTNKYNNEWTQQRTNTTTNATTINATTNKYNERMQQRTNPSTNEMHQNECNNERTQVHYKYLRQFDVLANLFQSLSQFISLGDSENKQTARHIGIDFACASVVSEW